MKFLFKKIHIVLLLIASMMLQVDAAPTPRERRATRTRAAKRVATTKRTRGARGARGLKRAPVRKSPRAVMQQVKKTTSTFESILDQSAIMINATGKTARSTRNTAKSEINKLMTQLKTENPKLHTRINDDVQTILKTGRTTESKDAAKEAYDNLIAVREKLTSEAKQAQNIRRNIEKVKMASPEQKQAVAAQAVAEIQAGNEAVEQAGIISRVTDFFLDDQISALTKLLYATVGATVLAGTAYVGYQYVVPAAVKGAETIYGMERKDWQNLPTKAKEAVKAQWEALTWERIKGMPSAAAKTAYGLGEAGARKAYEIGATGAGYVGTVAGWAGSAYNWLRGAQQVGAMLNEVKEDLTNALDQDPNNRDIKETLKIVKEKQNIVNEKIDKAANGEILTDKDKAEIQQSTGNVADIVANAADKLPDNTSLQNASKKSEEAQNILPNPAAAGVTGQAPMGSVQEGVIEQITPPMEGGVVPPVMQQGKVIEGIGGTVTEI